LKNDFSIKNVIYIYMTVFHKYHFKTLLLLKWYINYSYFLETHIWPIYSSATDGRQICININSHIKVHAINVCQPCPDRVVSWAFTHTGSCYFISLALTYTGLCSYCALTPFIYGLFYDCVSTSDYIASNGYGC
jgi:hypothetical protein